MTAAQRGKTDLAPSGLSALQPLALRRAAIGAPLIIEQLNARRGNSSGPVLPIIDAVRERHGPITKCRERRGQVLRSEDEQRRDSAGSALNQTRCGRQPGDWTAKRNASVESIDGVELTASVRLEHDKLDWGRGAVSSKPARAARAACWEDGLRVLWIPMIETGRPSVIASLHQPPTGRVTEQRAAAPDGTGARELDSA